MSRRPSDFNRREHNGPRQRDERRLFAETTCDYSEQPTLGIECSAPAHSTYGLRQYAGRRVALHSMPKVGCSE